MANVPKDCDVLGLHQRIAADIANRQQTAGDTAAIDNQMPVLSVRQESVGIVGIKHCCEHGRGFGHRIDIDAGQHQSDIIQHGADGTQGYAHDVDVVNPLVAPGGDALHHTGLDEQRHTEEDTSEVENQLNAGSFETEVITGIDRLTGTDAAKVHQFMQYPQHA